MSASLSPAHGPSRRLPAGLARLLLAVSPALPTLCAVAATLALFGAFLLVQGQPAIEALGLIGEGAAGGLVVNAFEAPRRPYTVKNLAPEEYRSARTAFRTGGMIE